jgi:hypothetical protein
MRRVALALATVGLIAAGLAVAPAQARENWRADQPRQEQVWRGHDWREDRDWRPTAFERHLSPRIIFGRFYR